MFLFLDIAPAYPISLWRNNRKLRSRNSDKNCRKTILSLEVNDANIVRGERDPERRAQLGAKLVRFAMSPSGQTLATLHDESSVKVHWKIYICTLLYVLFWM